MNISICIPTYNRADHLANCLNSIITCSKKSNKEFEVCISDNNSTDKTFDVVKNAQSSINIKYKKNIKNLGRVRNYLNVVKMAEGDFVWLIGDDDLLMPYAIEVLDKLINSNVGVDFFYVNAFHLTTDVVNSYPHPFDTENLPLKMIPFSNYQSTGKMPFFQLVDPKISFDFLGGMFLSVFRRKNWLLNAHVLDKKAIQDNRIFSHFDNTFPHVKIFAKAFSKSEAYFNTRPLSVCLTGAREWFPMNSLVMSVRLVEALKEYRKNGLPFWRYVYCKNYALNNFLPDFIKILLNKNSGYAYINPAKLLAESFFYPNFYLSFLFFISKKIKYFFSDIKM